MATVPDGTPGPKLLSDKFPLGKMETEPPVNASGRSMAEYDYCPECEEKVEPVIIDGMAFCPDCDGGTIYKPLYRFEVTRHVWKYSTVLAGSADEASTIADDDDDWEESPDHDETVERTTGGA